MRPETGRPYGDIGSRELATLWAGVYMESMTALEGASLRMSALVVERSGYRRRQVERADLLVVLDDLAVARDRLGFWRARLAELN